MIEILTLLFFFAIIFALSHIVISLRNIPFAGALPIAFSFLVALESIILNLLSVFHAVNRLWIFLCHAVLLFGWFVWVIFIKWDFTKRIFQRSKNTLLSFWKNPIYRLFLPVILLLVITALIYPPNNTDSMIYHMARVAHWIQNASIEYYPTPIDRQNVMGPGAEYIILFFQILTNDDVLANCVQLISYLILILSSGYLFRIFGMHKKFSSLMVILCASTPMALLQATNTKNDLVTTIMSFAIIIACLRFTSFNHIRKVFFHDYLILGISIAGGFLVKPTSLLVSLPIILAAVIYQLKLSKSIEPKKIIIGVAIFLLSITVVSGPDIYRKLSHGVERQEVYPLTSEWDADRLWNPLKTISHNFPFPMELKKFFNKLGYSGKLYLNDVFNHHEDLIGNPFQTLTILLFTFINLLFIPIVFIKSDLRPTLTTSLFPALAWICFALMVRDQLWIARLQLPLFYIAPISMLLTIKILNKKRIINKIISPLITAFAICSLSYGTVAAAKNHLRPIVAANFWGESANRDAAYYNNGGDKESDNFLIQKASEEECSQIGFIAGPNSYDYPLTWRSLKNKINIKHLRKAVTENGNTTFRYLGEKAEWPCMLQAASGVLEVVPEKGKRWLGVGPLKHTFIKNIEYDFLNSKRRCFSLKKENGLETITPLNQVSITERSGSIVLSSSGQDPHVLLPDFPVSDCGMIILQVVMKSQKKTIAQIYYSAKEIMAFSEEFSRKIQVNDGVNTIYFKLPGSKINGPLRFDPATESGKYTLYSIEARSVPPS